jgi:uncharacterized BrkB/YihY/UPF0761 family membrane protein
LRAGETLEAAIERVPVIGTVIEAGHRERSIGGGLLAGGLAYRLFFWLVPVGLMGAAASKLLGQTSPRDLSTAAGSRGLASVVATAERQAMDTNAANTWLLLGTGVVFSIWFGIGVVRALTIVHSLAWSVPIRKIRRPPLAGAVFTVIAGLTTLTANVVGRFVSALGLGYVAYTLTIMLAYGLLGLILTAVFPHPRVTWQALVPGAILIGAGGLVMHVFVNVYLAPKLGRSVSIYGLLGAATVILLWLFIIARMITVAAFLNAQIWYRDHPRTEPPRRDDLN